MIESQKFFTSHKFEARELPPEWEFYEQWLAKLHLTARQKNWPKPLHSLQNIDAVYFILVNSEEMRKLNLSYAEKDSATDVLTFHYEPQFKGDQNVVEIYICLEIAIQQASQHKTDLSGELALLSVHGLIHACGIDHEQSEIEMQLTRNLEREVLNLTGLPQVPALSEYE